jgi:hypothetical protein
MSEEEQHAWQYRVVWRENGQWKTTRTRIEYEPFEFYMKQGDTEAIIQRRRLRDHLDPTPCEGIEHPIWRDWEASPDPEIQAVLVRKGMPFRSLEK